MFRDLILNDSFRVINVSAKRTAFGSIPGTDKQKLFAFFCWWTQFILAKQHFILLTKALVYFLLGCVGGLAVHLTLCSGNLRRGKETGTKCWAV